MRKSNRKLVRRYVLNLIETLRFEVDLEVEK